MDSVATRSAGQSEARLAAWWNAGVLALAFGGLVFACLPPLADPDLWGHVRFGLDLWQTGRIVRPDTYSYLTGGSTWINHEWLAEALDGLAYLALGPKGLVALNLALGLALIGLLYRHMVRQGAGLAAAALVLAVFVQPLRPGLVNIRPQVFTYLGLALMLLIIYDASHGRRARLWTSVPLLAVWANLHGGVLAGAAIFLLWGLVWLLVARASRDRCSLPRQAQRAVVAAMMACPAALLLNPYGPALVAFLLRTATIPRPEIAEWNPMDLASAWGQAYLAALLLTAFGLIFSHRPRRADLLAVLLCTAVLPLVSARHAPLFAVAAAVLAGEHVVDAGRTLLARLPARWRTVPPRSWLRTWPVVALLFLAALAAGGLAARSSGRITIQPESAGFPARAVAVLRASGVAGHMATDFNWGEYVLWHLGPRVQVSVDGRRETVYSETVYHENLRFMFGDPGWDQLLREGVTDLALVDRQRPVFGLLEREPGWELAYGDAYCGIFARAGSPLLARIRAVSPPPLPPDGRGLAFPE